MSAENYGQHDPTEAAACALERCAAPKRAPETPTSPLLSKRQRLHEPPQLPNPEGKPSHAVAPASQLMLI